MIRHKNLIIIFTRNPELGKVKTRLASTIGQHSALLVYNFLLHHTEQIIRRLECDKMVYYSEKIQHDDIWNTKIYQKHLQIGEDLGARMYSAFQNAFQLAYEKVIIIGSDLYDLKVKHLNEAFNSLNKRDVVVGPAQDGGYYLLGMKSLYLEVFLNKKWGTSSVLKDTLKNLQKAKVHQLETLNDIDTYEDMKHIPELINLIDINE